MDMKRIKVFFLSVVCLVAVTVTASAAKYPNHPLPHRPDTLKILAIGNSFSDDGTQHLPALLEGAGIHNVIVARLYIGGCTLERHCQEYDAFNEKGLRSYIYYKSTGNKWETVSKKASILDGIEDEDWDIVTLQQASGYSGLYDSYNPYLERLIGIVRQHCSNPDATIVWHMTWAYATTSGHHHFKWYDKDQNKMYGKICGCVVNLKKDRDIPVVIPSGIAVQMGRGTSIAGEKELTRDGFHLSYSVGRYLAACTWFEALIRPTLGKKVKGNPARLQGTENEVSPETAKICQKLATRAVKKARRINALVPAPKE